MRYVIATLLLLTLTGCIVWYSNDLSHVGTPPNPNDPRQAGVLTPEVLRRILAGASDSLQEREMKGEIDDAKFHELMSEAANRLLDEVDIGRIPPKQAWEYGEIYITAQRWEDAKKALLIAVKAAKNDDRRVNDKLRLARVMAELNDVPGAISTARSTFDVPDGATAPILPATLLEIVKAGEGKAHDAELAALLEDAIKCEMRTIVDPKSKPGQDFLTARPFHIRNAWRKVVELYVAAGKTQEADSAEKRAEQMLSQQAGA
ncbi:MAG TPA: hypothetical protein VG820_00605 [Fimbriimonadaceae bacterium]|nr:hypothetical protein [Fimbriimonadaceae bacterium]